MSKIIHVARGITRRQRREIHVLIQKHAMAFFLAQTATIEESVAAEAAFGRIDQEVRAYLLAITANDTLDSGRVAS